MNFHLLTFGRKSSSNKAGTTKTTTVLLVSENRTVVTNRIKKKQVQGQSWMVAVLVRTVQQAIITTERGEEHCSSHNRVARCHRANARRKQASKRAPWQVQVIALQSRIYQASYPQRNNKIMPHSARHGLDLSCWVAHQEHELMTSYRISCFTFTFKFVAMWRRLSEFRLSYRRPASATELHQFPPRAGRHH